MKKGDDITEESAEMMYISFIKQNEFSGRYIHEA